MPLQTYRCTDGHLIEELVKLDRSDGPTICPQPIGTRVEGDSIFYARCSQPVVPVMAPPASVFPGASSWRK